MPNLHFSHKLQVSPETEIAWTPSDQRFAREEGWYMDLKTGQIQPDNSIGGLKFTQEEQRQEVYRRAHQGSQLHLVASILDARATLIAWEKSFLEATTQGATDAD